MCLKPIGLCTHIFIAILILAGLTACGRQKPESVTANAANPPEKQTRLADKVRAALKDNIFLKPEGLEVVVIDEKDGFVKLSVTKGCRRLRNGLSTGADLDSAFGTDLDSVSVEKWEADADRRSWTALKKTVDYVKTIDGVKSVLVTAETNTKLDQAEDLYGEGIEFFSRKDYEKAAGKMRQAAEIGDRTAQYAIGSLYHNGQGVTQDYKEAIKWWRLSAEQGYPAGQGWLGAMYYEGNGVSQDYKEAIKWWRLAAEQGDFFAQNSLAWIFATCRNSKLLDGQESVKYAKMAVAEKQEWTFIGTLAAAQARAGNFDEAIVAAEKSLAMLQAQKDFPEKEKLIRDAKERLQGYRNKQPWTEK